jgi:hypothetical protein
MPDNRVEDAQLALTDERISVPVGMSRTGAGASGIGWQPSADAIHLFRTQFTSAHANQHSVLVIHTFLSFHLWADATGPSLSKIPSNCGRAARYPELAFTNGGISVRAARFRISGASREGVYASFDKIDLFICKVASALANQYSVLVVHSFPSSSLSSVEA